MYYNAHGRAGGENLLYAICVRNQNPRKSVYHNTLGGFPSRKRSEGKIRGQKPRLRNGNEDVCARTIDLISRLCRRMLLRQIELGGFQAAEGDPPAELVAVEVDLDLTVPLRTFDFREQAQETLEFGVVKLRHDAWPRGLPMCNPRRSLSNAPSSPVAIY